MSVLEFISIIIAEIIVGCLGIIGLAIICNKYKIFEEDNSPKKKTSRKKKSEDK